MSTIAAISTPPGAGGIAVARLSGPDAIEIADKAWAGARLADAASHTAHLGYILDSQGERLDQAVALLMRGPRSYTGDDTVEFSLHGSPWIQRRVVERLVELGAEPAGAGEFTRRAFLNGRLDLAQAEGVADLIAASSQAAQRLAMTQMTGDFSSRLNRLRDKLVELASLLELELDFSEEEVEFADRGRLLALADDTLAYIDRLNSTYRAGKALKEGVPVAIAGAPNAGKSTLLNRLLDEDKAIVSDIPGTTRDVIEDTREIGGVLFRFRDTAGLRDAADLVENIGIGRARDAVARAAIVLWVVDMQTLGNGSEASGLSGNMLSGKIDEQLAGLREEMKSAPEASHIILLNKADAISVATDIKAEVARLLPDSDVMMISAKTGEGMSWLEERLSALSGIGRDTECELIVTNARHQAALRAGAESLRRARAGISEGLSADFIAQDLRESLHHLGTVTGAVTTDTLLASIFSSFCIGK